uniref:Uncharacterized protein n=1 Tax=Anguilla anguilla TaxID=7936 RepID=A0A0E9T3X5_ANGAN
MNLFIINRPALMNSANLASVIGDREKLHTHWPCRNVIAQP